MADAKTAERASRFIYTQPKKDFRLIPGNPGTVEMEDSSEEDPSEDSGEESQE